MTGPPKLIRLRRIINGAMQCTASTGLRSCGWKRGARGGTIQRARRVSMCVCCTPAQRSRAHGLTGIFERVWYGLRDAEATDYDRAKKLFTQLSDSSATANAGAAN